MSHARGLAAFCSIFLAAACDAEECPAFDDIVLEEVDAKEVPEPGAQVTHESNGPGEARVILEAWWVAEECDNPNTCPTETFELVGSLPMDRLAFGDTV